MTRPAPTSTGPAARESTPADRWISRAAAATVAALAGVAGVISYSHMRQLAQDHGQAGWHAHAFPLSVDGIEIVASLVLLADHRHRRRSGWLPWTALVIGTIGSLAANIATAGPGLTSRVIAGWPALALLIAVKLLSGMLGHQPAASHTGVISFRQPQNSRRAPSRSRSAARPVTAAVPADPGTATADIANVGPRPGPGSGPDTAALHQAARTAWEGLRRDGQPLTRDALARRLRDNGHRIQNSRLTPLLNILRTEAPGSSSARRQLGQLGPNATASAST